MTYDDVQQRYAQAGYRFYTDPYNLNLFGIRSDGLTVDEFNDQLGVAYTDLLGNKTLLLHRATTKPGLYWLKNKLGSINGTFILKKGRYPTCWTIGHHKGQYEALVQTPQARFEGWRDNDSDGELDYSGPLFTDVQGLNMHTESLINNTDKVGAYSAGCQVRQYDREHFMVIELCKMQINRGHGELFSYTLF